MIRFIALALAIAAASPALAQYGGYSAPCYGPSCYSTPSYHGAKTYGHSYGYRSQWSAWTYGAWPKDPTYFIYYRTWYDHCGVATNHNDGWLYCYTNGCYVKHCLISQYASKPVLYPSPGIEPYGRTEVGYHAEEYALVKRYPVAVGLIGAKDLPGTIDPRSFLAPYSTQAEARQLGVERAHKSTTEMFATIAAAENAKELEQIRGRNALARQVQAEQSDERFLAEIKELFAVRRQQSVIDAEATPRAVINVANPALAKLIQDRCVSCHGPQKAENGLNFATVAQGDTKVWGASYRKCATGEMPKGGEPLSNEDLDLFEEQMLFAVKSSR